LGHDDVDAVLDGLGVEGLQSDRRFAECLVRVRIGRGYGPLRILAELGRHGIAEDSFCEFFNRNDPRWVERIKRVRLRRFGAQWPEDPVEQARQARFLQQRGFTDEQIRGLMGAKDG
jgi:regulatory protein